MTTTPFDDPTAYDRRWTRRSREHVHRLAQRDPLLFVADHITVRDRAAGLVAVQADLGLDLPPVMILIADGPLEPDDDACLNLLAGVVERIDREYRRGPAVDTDEHEYETCIHALGLVTHRTGRPVVSDGDRAWARALDAVARWCDFEPVGVLTRTESGALVRVPPTPRKLND